MYTCEPYTIHLDHISNKPSHTKKAAPTVSSAEKVPSTRILNHKTVGGQTKFLVKYKGQEEAVWVDKVEEDTASDVADLALNVRSSDIDDDDWTTSRSLRQQLNLNGVIHADSDVSDTTSQASLSDLSTSSGENKNEKVVNRCRVVGTGSDRQVQHFITQKGEEDGVWVTLTNKGEEKLKATEQRAGSLLQDLDERTEQAMFSDLSKTSGENENKKVVMQQRIVDTDGDRQVQHFITNKGEVDGEWVTVAEQKCVTAVLPYVTAASNTPSHTEKAAPTVSNAEDRANMRILNHKTVDGQTKYLVKYNGQEVGGLAVWVDKVF